MLVCVVIFFQYKKMSISFNKKNNKKKLFSTTISVDYGCTYFTSTWQWGWPWWTNGSSNMYLLMPIFGVSYWTIFWKVKEEIQFLEKHIYYIKYAVSLSLSQLLSQNPSRFHPKEILSNHFIWYQDENLEHDEMLATRHAIVGIQNRGCIGYCLVFFNLNQWLKDKIYATLVKEKVNSFMQQAL